MKLSPDPKPFRYSLGERGEVLAAAYLKSLGFRILEKNYRRAIGEVDLIAEKAGRVHFIEIKTRTGHRFGRPEESVGGKKQAKLLKLAAWYLKEKDAQEKKVSMDVIAITMGKNTEPEIRYIPRAFEEPGL